ncbi:hypothetical protein C4561_05565 [candidate division WWE3 bacterium]|jgi:DNA polymerase-3 subunit delta'|uniref:DNA polymerase III subunit delta n=1 Tax=candidate division WWE3 bacterium TaxID=2053526 RepID=A0A3A4ZAW7_UNCKA|nr:MAG: hypothetical protein C4561_05565 [candidate division WWE3 bacterium]
MGTSYIVYGSSDKSRKKLIEEFIEKYTSGNYSLESENKNPDIMVIKNSEEKKSIGITQTKKGIEFLTEKPFSLKKKLLVIENAGKMTSEAQNSLLKTLEEPPEYSEIFLNVELPGQLLETVQSRCKKIKATGLQTEDTLADLSLKVIIESTLGQRLDTAKELSGREREDLISIIDLWVKESRKLMIDTYSLCWAENIIELTKFKNDLEHTNVNARMALEALLLKLT